MSSLSRLAIGDAYQVLTGYTRLLFGEEVAGLLVGHLLPPHLEAHVRVLPRFQVISEDPTKGTQHWRWSQLARSADAGPIEADTRLRNLLSKSQSFLVSEGLTVEPFVGEADPQTTQRILEILIGSEGDNTVHSYWWQGGHIFRPLVQLGPNGRGPRSTLVVCDGPVSSFLENDAADHGLSRQPTLLWSQTNSWAVVAHVDATSLYLGGSRRLVAAVLQDEQLEVIQVNPFTPADDSTAIA
jgi:hypothetical protein